MEGWWAASYVVLWLLVIALSVVVVALARQIGTLHLRLGPRGALELDDEGPALGDAPPPQRATTVEGREIVVGGPGPRRLLLFASPGCLACEDVLPSVEPVARAGTLEPLVISDADTAETAAAFDRRSLPAPVVAGRKLVASYNVPGTPYVVVLDENGAVRAKGTVNNLEQMEGLVDTAARRMGTLAGSEVVG